MKTFRILLLTLAALLVCGTAAQAKSKNPTTKVEVIVFHGVKQCETCKAIKKNSEEVAQSLKSDKVTYRVVDFSKDEGKAEAEKYKIAWTSLVLVKHDAAGNETVNNLSQYAIKNARTNTADFRKKLAAEIKKMLK